MNTQLPSRPARARVPGHALTIDWSGFGTRGRSMSSGKCTCGWTESCDSVRGVRDEYAYHLDRAWLRLRGMSDAALASIDVNSLRAAQALVINCERYEREQIAAWTWVSPTHLRLRVGQHELNVYHYHGEGWRWWIGHMLATAELSGGPHNGIDGRYQAVRDAKAALEDRT